VYNPGIEGERSKPTPIKGVATMSETISIRLICNNEAGYADNVTVPAGTSIGELFREKMPEHNPADYVIRVNAEPVQRAQILCNGDRVTISPQKVAGA